MSGGHVDLVGVTIDAIKSSITTEIEPYVAQVTALDGAKVFVQPMDAEAALQASVPRLAGFDVAVNDYVLVIGRRAPVVLGQIWTAFPSPVALTPAIHVTGAISGGLPQPAFFVVPGFQATNNSSVTTPTSNQIIAQYLGVSPRALTSITVRFNVTTAVSASPTWAEVGIAKGTPTMGSGASLTRIGYTNVATTFNSTGLKDTVISVSAAAGDHLWVMWGSQAATPYVVRGGGIGDALSTGRNQFVAATRISTMSANTAFGVTSGSANDAWIAAAW